MICHLSSRLFVAASLGEFDDDDDVPGNDVTVVMDDDDVPVVAALVFAC